VACKKWALKKKGGERESEGVRTVAARAHGHTLVHTPSESAPVQAPTAAVGRAEPSTLPSRPFEQIERERTTPFVLGPSPPDAPALVAVGAPAGRAGEQRRYPCLQRGGVCERGAGRESAEGKGIGAVAGWTCLSTLSRLSLLHFSFLFFAHPAVARGRNKTMTRSPHTAA